MTHLTDDQIAFFDEHGYLVLPGRVPAGLLERLRAAADGWTAMSPTPLHADGALWRVDHLHDKGSTASLELLGSPAVLGIAESLAGPDPIPTYESLVVKAAGSGAPVPWHQDAVHPRRHRLFNVDVYLDAAVRDRGALHVLPGSQTRRADVCAVRDEHGWAVPGAVQVEMAPGDVLVHDDMVVHGSPPSSGPAQRRTVYLEFRPAASIVEDGPWDADWLARRRGLLATARAVHAGGPVPTATPLRIPHGVHTPGEWCSAG